MDTTDPNIEFNLAGLCSHCINFDERISKEWSPQGSRFEEILPRIQRIRKQGRDLPYDCIIGISGGLDSSYVAYVAKEVFELRPLLFHVDAGWNTKHAVENVGKIVSGLKLDLYTEVINWEEMRDLQVAFFAIPSRRSGFATRSGVLFIFVQVRSGKWIQVHNHRRQLLYGMYSRADGVGSILWHRHSLCERYPLQVWVDSAFDVSKGRYIKVQDLRQIRPWP